MNGEDTVPKTLLVICVIGTLFVPLQTFAPSIACQGIPATIIGTAGNDVLIGTQGSDVIVALGGDDFVNGYEGDDTICGDEGKDTLYGYLGNDMLYGGDGYDIIQAGPDNDSCSGGEENYYCEIMSNEAKDTTAPTVSIISPSGGVLVSGTITISAGATDNVGVATVEFYVNGALIGSDTANNYAVSWNTKTVPNGPHIFTARAYDTTGNVADSEAVSVTVNNVALDPNAEVVTCQGVPATIIGTQGNDILDGTEGNDVISGLGGKDVIIGYGGDDIICGNDGNDNLRGYSGNDILDGGNGADSLIGGSGNDTLYGGSDRDLLNGGSGNDTLYGDDGEDFLDGGMDEDTCVGEYKSNCP